MIDFEQWEGFEGRIWKEEVNVRDFIQKNYTPYDGDESFLAGPTEATDKLWGALQKLQKAERAKGGDLPADKPAKDAPDFPFAGGSGAGVSVQPVGFLVLSGDTVRMLPATCSSVADRVVDLIPTVVEDVKSFLTHQ